MAGGRCEVGNFILERTIFMLKRDKKDLNSYSDRLCHLGRVAVRRR